MRKYYDIATYQGFYNSFAFLHQTPTHFNSESEFDTTKNGYVWNTTLKAIHINDTGDNFRGGLTFDIGRLELGDKVICKCEFLVLSGDGVGIYLDVGNTNKSKIKTSKIGQWEEITLEVENPIQDYNSNKGRSSIFIGSVTAEKNNYYVRNVQCEVITNESYMSPKIPLEIKTFSILINGDNSFNNQDIDYMTSNNGTTFFAMDSCTITTGTNGGRQGIKITYKKPFTCPTYRGFAIAQFSSNTSSKYIVKCESQTADYVWLVIYDTSTHTVVNPTTLYSKIGGASWINLLVIGGSGYY